MREHIQRERERVYGECTERVYRDSMQYISGVYLVLDSFGQCNGGALLSKEGRSMGCHLIALSPSVVSARPLAWRGLSRRPFPSCLPGRCCDGVTHLQTMDEPCDNCSGYTGKQLNQLAPPCTMKFGKDTGKRRSTL